MGLILDNTHLAVGSHCCSKNVQSMDYGCNAILALWAVLQKSPIPHCVCMYVSWKNHSFRQATSNRFCHIIFFVLTIFMYIPSNSTDENVGHSSFLRGGSGHLVIVIMAVFWSHDQDHGGVENSAHLRAGVWFVIPWGWDLVLGLKSRLLSCGLEA